MTATDLLRRLVDWDDCQSDNGNTNLGEIVSDTATFLKEYDEAPVVELNVVILEPGRFNNSWSAYAGVNEDSNKPDAVIRFPVPRHLWKPEKIDAEVVE